MEILARRHLLPRLGNRAQAALQQASAEHYLVTESTASIDEFRRSTGQRRSGD